MPMLGREFDNDTSMHTTDAVGYGYPQIYS